MSDLDLQMDNETMESGDELTQQLNNEQDKAIETPKDNEYDFDDPASLPDEDSKETNKEESKEETSEEGNYFDNDLVQKAFDYGLSKEEIEAFGNNDVLTHHLTSMDKQFLSIGKEQLNKPISNDNSTNKNIPVSSDKETGFKVNLSPDVYEQELIDTVEGLNKFYQDKLSGLESKLEQITQKEIQRETDYLYDTFDSIIDGLEDSYKDVLGKGSRHDIDKGSEQFKNRVKILENVNALDAGLKSMNKPVPNFESLVQKAINMEYSNLAKKNVRQDIAKQLDKQKNRFTIPPTNVNPKAVSGRDKAIMNIKKKLGDSEDNNYF